MCPLKDAARDTPHFPALALREKTFSFSELDRIADMQAKELLTLGIEPGDRIAVCHLPKEELIPLFFASWRVGASICPLSPRLPQLEPALLRLKPKLLYDTRTSFPRSTLCTPHSALLFTSGSTGTPKIAILSLDNLLKSALFALEPLQFQPRDRWLLSLPLNHVGGIGIVLRAILGRGTIALDERDPEITHVSNVPTQLYRAWPIYPKLKCLLVGGGPIGALPEQLPAVASYGLTEMGSLVGIGTRFEPLQGREVRIARDGEIWVRGACRFQGYWEEEAPFDKEGWFPTGDLGRVDGQKFTVLGRKDWMFISGGENIQPEEIEKHLMEMPEVVEAVVLPISDPEFGKRPIAVLSAKCTEKKIRSFLLERLPKYKIPTAFYFIEELPKMGMKIDRKWLLKNFIRSDFFIY